LLRGIYAVRARTGSGDLAVRGILRNRTSASTLDVRSESGDVELRPR
jgi:hypothetical protein